jgi:hypothetical protein
VVNAPRSRSRSSARRLAGVDPIEYLADVLPRLTRRIRLLDLPALLPSRLAASRANATTAI